MVRNSVLSSTSRRGSISFVSTTNPAAVRGQPETRVQRREADNPHPQTSASHQSGFWKWKRRGFCQPEPTSHMQGQRKQLVAHSGRNNKLVLFLVLEMKDFSNN